MQPTELIMSGFLYLLGLMLVICDDIIIFLLFQTEMPEQTVKTNIRLLEDTYNKGRHGGGVRIIRPTNR